jgi:hypothetical protein
LCCVFVLFFFVLCAMSCQFLWIVHFWLPLWYSLMFIYNQCHQRWYLNFCRYFVQNNTDDAMHTLYISNNRSSFSDISSPLLRSSTMARVIVWGSNGIHTAI